MNAVPMPVPISLLNRSWSELWKEIHRHFRGLPARMPGEASPVRGRGFRPATLRLYRSVLRGIARTSHQPPDRIGPAQIDFYLRAVLRLLDRDKLLAPGPSADWKALCARLAEKDWIVYAKKPFAGPKQVLEYLERYTHKVAISDYRILANDSSKVTFRYRDRADNDTGKTISISAEAFIRRFLLHILPPGLQKIRFSAGWVGT